MRYKITLQSPYSIAYRVYTGNKLTSSAFGRWFIELSTSANIGTFRTINMNHIVSLKITNYEN